MPLGVVQINSAPWPNQIHQCQQVESSFPMFPPFPCTFTNNARHPVAWPTQTSLICWAFGPTHLCRENWWCFLWIWGQRRFDGWLYPRCGGSSALMVEKEWIKTNEDVVASFLVGTSHSKKRSDEAGRMPRQPVTCIQNKGISSRWR